MKLALITGGSTGLGQALTEAYLAADFEVLEFSRSGEGAHHVSCDLGDPQAASQVLQQRLRDAAARDDYESVVFLSNAGVIEPIGPVAASQPEQWQHSLQVNLVGAITAMGLFLQAFQDHKGHKVLANVSSGAAQAIIPGWSLYCAAKAGLEHFIGHVAVEQEDQRHPITAINIDPGLIDTPMQARIRDADPDQFPGLQRFLDYKTQGALKSPSEVAARIKAIIDRRPVSGTRYITDSLAD